LGRDAPPSPAPPDRRRLGHGRLRPAAGLRSGRASAAGGGHRGRRAPARVRPAGDRPGERRRRGGLLPAGPGPRVGGAAAGVAGSAPGGDRRRRAPGSRPPAPAAPGAPRPLPDGPWRRLELLQPDAGPPGGARSFERAAFASPVTLVTSADGSHMAPFPT